MSLCNLPSFLFALSIPLPSLSFPSFDFSFSLAFTLPPCPID